MTVAQQATVIAVVNPDTDPVTMAWSKVDVYAERFAGSDDEIARMESKLTRAKADAAAAADLVRDAKAAKTTRRGELDQAQAELAAAEAEHPDLAAVIRARRDLARAQRRKELTDKLAQLGDN